MAVQTGDTRRRNQVLKRFVSDLAELDTEQRAQQITALLRGLVHPGMIKDWCGIVEVLTADQPPLVAEQLAPFRAVADVLRDGDPSRGDALPPEQREFAAEVLKQFVAAANEQQAPRPPSLSAMNGGAAGTRWATPPFSNQENRYRRMRAPNSHPRIGLERVRGCEKTGRAPRSTRRNQANLVACECLSHSFRSLSVSPATQATSTHWPDLALARTASQIFWVSSASRNVGEAGWPLPIPSRKSANWWMKVCS